ncbi:hypothetical protein TcasGA2_TC034501 [Tribolium castaneum]|uniref:Uncharacterized protein n=2 Tax=Tribolium castaneum TaxID=7070 RepID=A0A139W8R6_TRICA|nr:hypothetical protein TcasGA2_TC034501 [Tribolium castaneum]
MGSIKYPKLASLSRKIWQWCESKNIWVFASYINSKDNFLADRESRTQSTETEWELNNQDYNTVVYHFGQPEVDLFASKINAKCRDYISWHRDPDSMAVDAFTVSWSCFFFYAFPPFSLILRTINKIITDEARGILIVPKWTSQPWYPLLSKILVDRTNPSTGRFPYVDGRDCLRKA